MKPAPASVSLSDIADINPWLPAKPKEGDVVSFLGMAAVDAESGTTSRGEPRPYSDVSKGYTPFLNNDVLVAKITPCFENCKIAQALIDHPVGFGSTEFHVIRSKSAKADPRFLLHFLRQPAILHAGERRMTGSAGQKRVPEKFFAALKIPDLRLDEQRRIADILDRADALRAKRRATLARLDELTQAIFIEMFGDPVSNPKGWPTVTLAQVGNLDRGVSKHRPRNDSLLLGGTHPLIQTGEVSNCDGYIRAFNATYSDFGLKQSRLWPAGTLCVTIAANIAKTGILTFDACFPDSIVGFTADEPATVEYVRVWLTFLQKTLEDNAPESAQKNINLAILRDLKIPLPPIERQRAFSAALKASEALNMKHQLSDQSFNALFASLQDRAFRGAL